VQQIRDGVGVEMDEEAAVQLCDRAAEIRTFEFGLIERQKREIEALMRTAPA
jgi:hypothetical protein